MKKLSPAIRAIALPWLLAVGSNTAVAQCEPDWLPGPGIAGTDGDVWRLMKWDPDGNGPLPLKIVACGDFQSAGNAFARHIAAWDPSTGEWSGFGQGLEHEVEAIATLPNGDLVAGGRFSAGGVYVANVARWDGTNWQGIGGGLLNRVRGLATTQAGEIIAVGPFNHAFVAGGGGATVTLNHVAMWSGGDWMPLGSGTDEAPSVVVVMPNGDIIIGGQFTTAGGTPASNVARWEGTSWSPLGLGVTGSSTARASCMIVQANGDLIVGGQFTSAGGTPASNVARWDGTSWSSMASGFPNAVYSLEARANGNVLATTSSPPPYALQEWDGTSWQQVAPGVTASTTATLPNGDIIAGGTFTTAGGNEALRIARWDGTQWSAMPSPGNSWLTVDGLTSHGRVASAPNGDLLTIGTFEQSPTITISGVIRYDGTSWQPLGGGIASWPIPYPLVYDMIAMPDGDVVVGGWIVQAGTQPVGHIARWNGGWSSIGGGMDGRVFALAAMPNGDLLAGGDFTTAGGVAANNIARWDGTSWSPLGSGSAGLVLSVLAMPNGDIVASGSFTTPSGTATVAKWDGTSWTSMNPAGNNGVTNMRLMPNGDIAALGLFAPAIPATIPNIGIWNGTTWNQIPALAAYVSDILPTPDGGLIAVGSLYNIGSTQVYRIARWDGTSWSAMPGTLDYSLGEVTLMPNGDIVASGTFTGVGSYAAPGIARLSSNCPATVVSTGSGCASSGGNNELKATSLPWTSSTFRANGTGLPNLAFVSQVYGFGQTQLPLSAILPQALPGCDLLVTPDHVVFSFTANGSATTELPIPAMPSLVGLTIHHQLNLFEVNPALTILEVTASNALVLTIGTF